MRGSSRIIQVLASGLALLTGLGVLISCHPRPAFVESVSPAPDQSVYLGINSSRIWAILRCSRFVDPGEVITFEQLRARITFLVDGEAMPIYIDQKNLPEPRLQVMGDFELPIGVHSATIQVQKSSGTYLTYSWDFTVLGTDQIPGLPRPFQFVRPLPGSTISMYAYRSKELVPELYRGYLFEISHSICVGVYSSDLAEPYQESSSEDIAGRYTLLSVDTLPPQIYKPIHTDYTSLSLVTEDSAGSKTMYQYPYNNQCWPIHLRPGIHTATAQAILTDSTPLTFTWQFTITQ